MEGLGLWWCYYCLLWLNTQMIQVYRDSILQLTHRSLFLQNFEVVRLGFKLVG